ncbi:hydantoinase B/oxoprolinase family protein [Sphingomonas crocodyli]|uniref:Hydantoinase B/oxoprolinase family protein n=1 Tax=Sphingomonas crocodyli TaxID=1979270 RepID=A0A437M5Z5_9SPHN|nr:hydantoinase B/oxoprolinase family protein [Sphingomonas crocodyli]RVT92924.1 hydantoinase B/oxoprolinase family protein [Sphingomonas crocodyli]
MAISGQNLQILMNHCAAAADAMAFTLLRTAHSTFIKETEDFSCTILSADGHAIASPHSFGAPWYSGIDYSPMLDLIPSYKPGDICISNDPYSGHVATHTPDIHIWKPVFYKGELACFVAGHIHNTDVGGAVPASLSRSLSEIVQEGLRIPPVKIVSAGLLNEELAALMQRNVRAPDQNWGDFKAQLASVNIGERKMVEIIDRFGLDDFRTGTAAILDYAHAQARRVIQTIPNGEYFFSDYADDDGASENPCRIALTLRVEDDAVEFDYTGSDPQLSSSLNMPTGGLERHPLALVGLTFVLSTLSPGILLNAGTLRAARAILPQGTVVNCEPPAAVGMRSLTCTVMQSAAFGAFAQALPELLPAAAAGGIAIVNVKTFDRHSMPVMASLGPVGGGGGGMPAGDGAEGCGGYTAFLRNTPVEIIEVEVPVRMKRYGLWPDTGGPGRYRGGLASVMEFEVTSPNTVVTSRSRDRSLFSAWGLAGGQAGTTALFLKNPGTGKERSLGNIDFVNCEPGDVIRMIGPGAGGYGDPLTRDPALVVRDVQCGFVSAENAKIQYGVILSDNGFDPVATEAHRANLVSTRANGFFDLGAFRDRFETTWTTERYGLLTELLSSVPTLWRQFLKDQVFTAVAEGRFAENGTARQMRALKDDLIERYPFIVKAA